MSAATWKRVRPGFEPAAWPTRPLERCQLHEFVDHWRSVTCLELKE
jgi:hypothetical protein